MVQTEMQTFNKISTPKSDLITFLKHQEISLIIPGNMHDARDYISRMRVELSRAKKGLITKGKPVPKFKTKLTYSREGSNTTWITMKMFSAESSLLAEVENEMSKILDQVGVE